MNTEEIARINHKSWYNCAMSVYAAFADSLGISQEESKKTAPRPRSEGGKCDAFLAGKKIVQCLKPEAAELYEDRFIELNGQTECSRLISAHGKLRKSCNDYVGDAARLIQEILQ